MSAFSSYAQPATVEDQDSAANICFREADELCRREDPESKPYQSKYEARELLRHLLKRHDLQQDAVARAQYRLGRIAMDVEEPHEAEPAFEKATEAFFPGLSTSLAAAAGDEFAESKPADGASPPPQLPGPVAPAALAFAYPEEALDLLNRFGLLCTQRGKPRRSVLYLLASVEAHATFVTVVKATTHTTNSNSRAEGAASASEEDSSSQPGSSCAESMSDSDEAAAAAKRRQRLDALQTHACFYLAQVYAHLGDAPASSRFCALTLRRQRQAALASQAGSGGGGNDGSDADGGVSYSAAEWAGNACSLADYHLGRNSFEKAGKCLAAALYTITERRKARAAAAAAPGSGGGGGSSGGGSSGGGLGGTETAERRSEGEQTEKKSGSVAAAAAVELELLREKEADLQRRLGRFYVMLMQVKHEELALRESGDAAAADALFSNSQEFSASVPGTENDADVGCEEAPPLPDCSPSKVACNYEGVSALFKRASRHLQAALGYFVLDGFVSDHVKLCQELSRAYKHLAAFEKDNKRRQAMLGRRVAALEPLLAVLGQQVYGELHIELSYELGEIYSDMADLKALRIEQKEKGFSGGAMIKRAETQRFNELMESSIKNFEHFGLMFEPAKPVTETVTKSGGKEKGDKKAGKSKAVSNGGGGGYPLDRSTLGPYLRAKFNVARLQGRLRYDDLNKQLEALEKSLRGYEWLVENAPATIAEVCGGKKGDRGVVGVEPQAEGQAEATGGGGGIKGKGAVKEGGGGGDKDEDEGGFKGFDTELGLAKEMTGLLPTKMAHVKRQVALAARHAKLLAAAQGGGDF